jgi:hypothetical protein
MQKHKFCKMCPNVILIEIAPGPLEQENWCVDISHHGSTRNALRDPQIVPDAKAQVQCNVSSMLFMDTAPAHTKREK